MVYDKKRRADEQRFVDHQRMINIKHAFFWFIKRLIIFTVLVLYTIMGAYVFEVSAV